MLVGAWLVATDVATLIAWVAVSRVAEQVAAPPALPLPSPLLAVLDSAEPPPATAAAAPSGRPRPVPSPTRKPPVDEELPAGDPPPNADPEPAEEAEESAPEPPEPAAITEGYRLTGGTVTVRYRNGEAELVQASPSSGFVMEINDPGPGKVDVRFRSEDHESRLVAQWRDGGPQPEREERER
jgi:hypothetical protein